MDLGDTEIAAVLILHVDLFDAVLKLHFVLQFLILLETERSRIIHFENISRFKL